MKDVKHPHSEPDEHAAAAMFQNKWLNRLTRTHIAFPVVIFLIYAAGLLYYTKIATDLGNWTVTGLFFSGLLFFTFVEYAVHRWLYHPPKGASERYKKFTHKIHGIHHDYPKYKQRLAMPPILAIVIATLLMLLFELVLDQYSFSVLAGFVTGYALYLMVHYATHIYKMPNNIFRAIWINHAIHHYAEEDIAFGVSSPLWDYVFGTMPKKKHHGVLEVKR
jgi:sterol desaturase/sphingolipid hydroxylase (fatty acid hydroxylase superfamily)